MQSTKRAFFKMMAPMRFSIITISFNGEKYLAETLESVASQTYRDFEHILWDGGSKDKTISIASSFDHVQIFEGKDEGIADAMNKGAALAKGDFLIFLHADDRLAHSHALEHMATCLHQHPQVKWLYGRAHMIDFKGEILRTTPFEAYTFNRLRKYNFITHPTVAISKNLFDRVGGFEKKLRYCMDYDLWLRLAPFESAFPLASVVACFREHAKSLSTSEPFKVTDEAYLVRNCYVTSAWERFNSYRIWKKRKKKLSREKA